MRTLRRVTFWSLVIGCALCEVACKDDAPAQQPPPLSPHEQSCKDHPEAPLSLAPAQMQPIVMRTGETQTFDFSSLFGPGDSHRRIKKIMVLPSNFSTPGFVGGLVQGRGGRGPTTLTANAMTAPDFQRLTPTGNEQQIQTFVRLIAKDDCGRTSPEVRVPILLQFQQTPTLLAGAGPRANTPTIPFIPGTGGEFFPTSEEISTHF